MLSGSFDMVADRLVIVEVIKRRRLFDLERKSLTGSLLGRRLRNGSSKT
jgi:hypothetical protein